MRAVVFSSTSILSSKGIAITDRARTEGVVVVREVRMLSINSGIYHGPDDALTQRVERLMSGIYFYGRNRLVADPGQRLRSRARAADGHPGNSPADGAGSAAGFFGRIFSKVSNAVTNLMNLTTYFEMKKRAGTVGKAGVAPLLDKLAGQVERIHLVGHSFGGRVVTAAAANSTTKKLHSMGLLQAAFSHNGFSKSKKGFFRSVVDSKRVNGPIFITHTKNDKAVGLAYPAASRISNHQAEAFGGADDPFGGIGSNGAQQMEAGEIFETTKTMQPVGDAYQWKAGRLHNLDSTKFIIDPKGGDAHGFVFVKEVAWAISRAIILK